MTEFSKSKSAKPGMGLNLFKCFVRSFLNKFYYRKVYSIDTENIPENCPLMVISNHQNSLCDPLALLLAIRGRKEKKHRVLARASIFNNPVANSFLRWLGLLPAYRLLVDGEEQLNNNIDTFELIENELLQNGTIIVFPEGKHQNKHWLGEFSSGYLRMLFQAAEKSNFEKELFILPTCNHYADYFAVQSDMLIKFGKPISIAPYYELYKTKPRTVQRELNALVREQVSEMMLNITDLNNYEVIDYLRNTYGVKYAKAMNFDPEKLPEKLLADKKLYSQFEVLKAENEELIQAVYDEASILKQEAEQLGVENIDLDRKTNLWELCFLGFIIVLFFPLFVCTFIPNTFVIYFPRFINKKIKDPMMHSAVRIIISILITIPLSAILIFGLIWIISKSFLIAIICLCCFPFLSLFFFNYKKKYEYWKNKLHYYKFLKKGELDNLISLHKNLYEKLDKLLDIK